jgi:hypothetical protein
MSAAQRNQADLAQREDEWMRYQDLVISDGEPCTGWGQLFMAADGAWLNPPTAQPGVPIVPARSPLSTRLEGPAADAAVAGGIGDTTHGWVTVSGVWRGDRMHVDRVTTDRPPRPRRTWWQPPPCPPPPGGWPRGFPPGNRGEGNLDFAVGDLEATGAIVNVVMFRPSPDQVVAVAAATDPAAAEAYLRPQLGARLCVVASRWTRAQIDHASSHLHAMHDPWRIYLTGQRTDDQAQVSITASLVQVTAEIADWAASQPDGLITLNPCLRPTDLPT